MESNGKPTARAANFTYKTSMTARTTVLFHLTKMTELIFSDLNVLAPITAIMTNIKAFTSRYEEYLLVFFTRNSI